VVNLAQRTLNRGLFERVFSLMELVERIPDDLSDEEVEGITALLPTDVAQTVTAFLEPRVRRAGIFFLKMIARWMREAVEAKSSGKKVIFVPFNFVPELIHAFKSAVPLTSEVLSSLGAAAVKGKGHVYWDFAMGLGIPDHLCSSSTIELGSMLSGTDMTADAIISSAAGACDANAKIHEFAANYLGIPQFVLEKPVDDTSKGIEQYEKNFLRLTESLERFTGEALSEEGLQEVASNINRASEIYYEIWEMKKLVPCPVPNLFSFFMYGCRFTMWGRKESVDFFELMAKEVKEGIAKGKFKQIPEKVRCGWLYTGYYIDYAGLFSWMQDKGYSYLWDILDLFFPEPISIESRESILSGICESSRRFPMTRQMGAESMSAAWLEDAAHIARELSADCAIFCGHHACKQTWSVISMVSRELQRISGIPTLNLQGDAWLSRVTPISVIQSEIDSFVRNVIRNKGERRKIRRRKGWRTTQYPTLATGLEDERE